MKRLLVWLVALCMICTMFAGCSGPEPEGTETGGNGSSEATKRTDLNLALVGVVSTLDPFASSLTVDLMLYRQIYESFTMWMIMDKRIPLGFRP